MRTTRKDALAGENKPTRTIYNEVLDSDEDLQWRNLQWGHKEVYLQIFKCVSFWLHGYCGQLDGWALKPVNHTSWMTVVTPSHRPKSVRNR